LRETTWSPKLARLGGIIRYCWRDFCLAARRKGTREVIVGMGVDMEEISRLREAIARHGRAFLERVFTPAEIAYCERHRDSAERFAGRFAAKEAAMKALGTGWSRGVRWVDLEVVRQRGGRPTLSLKGEAKKIADALGVKNIAISITHTSEQAIAQVIFEG
jgi:holo-[acyl-carrier protein] synthase